VRLGVTALAAVALAAPSALGAGAAVTIADTGTTASALQADMNARALTAQGLTVTRVSHPTARAADAALHAGAIDAYVTDTATLLENVLARRTERRVARIATVLSAASAPRGVVPMGYTAADDSPTVACTRPAMRRHRIGALATLGRFAPSLSYGATPQHVVRADGLPVLRARFRRVVVTRGDARFNLIRRGKVHCVLSSGVEPRAARLNLVTLRDGTRRLAGTPAFGVTVTSRAYLDGAHAAYTPTINGVGKALTPAAVREARGRIELDRQPVGDAAAARLAAAGIPG